MSGSAPGAPGPAGERGYVLFGVLAGAALLGVGLLAAVELWSQLLKREAEAELVFRGEAIVRAIERFGEDRPGDLPESLEELVERRYLRKAWLDPVTRRPFRLLRAPPAAAPGVRPGADPGPFPGAGPAAGLPDGRGMAAVRAGEIVAGPPLPPDPPGPTEPGAALGVVGVASTSDELSLRLYEGARRYRDWRFEARPSAAPAASADSRDEFERGRPR